jgi:hypothetical protein
MTIAIKIGRGRIWRMRALAAIVLYLAGTAATASVATPNCIPEFPFKDGWLGADAAYSIPLPDGRSVWIFGDTLYGDARLVEGNTPRMVRNSIGISTCTDEKWNIEYLMRKDSGGRPQDFFEAHYKGYWYWALDGFLYGSDLWVTLLCIRDKPSNGSPAFAFETCGADLARLSGLTAPPQQWKIEYFPLVADGVRAYPSATAVVEGEYAYLFAMYEEAPRPMLLTRIALHGLDSPRKHLEYLAKDGTWKPGLDPARAQHVMVPGASEMSVRYHADVGKWLAVMIGPEFPSDKIVLRTAPRLIGPWSEAQVIFRIPDVQPGAPAYDRETFCYAAKEHPEFAPPGKLLLTYVCNSLTPMKVATNPTIYFPKAVLVPLPQGD